MTISSSSQAHLDWNLLRVFLAVAETGSLSKAARKLALSQPTLSRNVSDLETSLGVRLFERISRGMHLTEAGRALLEPARQMQKSAENFSQKAFGQTKMLMGTIRLTACEMISGHILPSILSELRQTHPEIQIELVATDYIVNVLEREADIAIRHTKPKQVELISKKLGNAKMGLFAHVDYLQRLHDQAGSDKPLKYDWIGLDQSNLWINAFQKTKKHVDRNFFSFRCDNIMVGWQAALSGLGVVPAFKSIAKKWPEMQQIKTESPVESLPIWLVAHRELWDNPRMRVTFDALTRGLNEMIDM